MIKEKSNQYMIDFKTHQHMRDKTPIEKDTKQKRGYQKKDIT